MKKSIGIALAALLCVSGIYGVEEISPKMMSEEQKMNENPLLGREMIAQVRKDYEDGKYDDFLKKMHASYEEVLENGSLDNLRIDTSIDYQFLDSVRALQKETREELVQAVKDDSTPFAEKVRSVVALDPQEPFFLEIHQKSLGSGKTNDENALIAIDVEYEYKTLHLNMPQIQGQEIEQDTRAQYYALKMEQMDKFLLAAQLFEDESLKQAVESFGRNLDTRLAQNYDQMDLLALTQGRVKPTSTIESTVLSILQTHQEKMKDLYQSQ
jgi:hypothetical protein